MSLRRGAVVLLAMTTMIGACRDRPDAPPPPNSDNPLEAVARERGVVMNAAMSPDGLYERRHELGRDALCIAGGKVGVMASYGPALRCAASGTVSHEADGLSVDLGQGCRFTLGYDGESIVIPGTVPDACAALCPDRASLSGLTIPRVSWRREDGAALVVTDKADTRSRPCR